VDPSKLSVTGFRAGAAGSTSFSDRAALAGFTACLVAGAGFVG
jgi:hypothetical protein